MVIAKAATSIDARIAAAPGARTQLTSAEANRRTQRLRAAVDAIGIGLGTLLTDDPILTVRDCFRPRPLARVVFDRRLRTPATARLFSTLEAGPVIILTTAAATGGHPERAQALKSCRRHAHRRRRRLATGFVARWCSSTSRRFCSKVAPRCTRPHGRRAWSIGCT